MRSATKRKFHTAGEAIIPPRSATKPKLKAVSGPEPAAVRPAGRSKPRLFHASVQVTRIEQWFVEAKTAEQARALLQSGHGQRTKIGECVHFEIGTLTD